MSFSSRNKGLHVEDDVASVGGAAPLSLRARGTTAVMGMGGDGYPDADVTVQHHTAAFKGH